MYEFRIYDENGDEVQVLETDMVDSGEPGVRCFKVYFCAPDDDEDLD